MIHLPHIPSNNPFDDHHFHLVHQRTQHQLTVPNDIQGQAHEVAPNNNSSSNVDGQVHGQGKITHHECLSWRI